MHFSRTFFRTAAVCSIASALTTLLLIFLPRLVARPSGFDERMALYANPAYALRSWTYLVHPFLVLVAAWGVVAKRHRRSTGAVTTGFLFFVLWAFTEAAQQALTVVAFDRTWRASYAAADEAARAVIRTQVATYDALWDAMYFLVLIGFLLANILYGVATWRGRGLERVVSTLYFAAAGLTLALLSGELSGPELPPTVEFWLYPALQPLARTLIGVWLWRGDNDT